MQMKRKPCLSFSVGRAPNNTCAKVQAPWERKPHLNLQLLEEGGWRASGGPLLLSVIQGRLTGLRTVVGVCKSPSVPGHTYYPVLPEKDFIKEINRCATSEWWGGGNIS